jgi:hypothetical protein
MEILMSDIIVTYQGKKYKLYCNCNSNWDIDTDSDSRLDLVYWRPFGSCVDCDYQYWIRLHEGEELVKKVEEVITGRRIRLKRGTVMNSS